ncbi:uncharacterized protein LOC124261820, partial [Haliotis rubra]|uniref:uncharacterized protein LOC124261820 n=1 Tax=Haliotis rubra TaxID=36100 RepID=UPI001EE5B8A5
MMSATAATVQDTGPEIVLMTGPSDHGGQVEAVDTGHHHQGGEGGATDPDLDPDLEEVGVETGGRGVEVAAEAVTDAVNVVAGAAEAEVVAGTRRGEHHGVVLEAGEESSFLCVHHKDSVSYWGSG